MAKRYEQIHISECPVCGKLFVPAVNHIYKVDFYTQYGNSRKRVCSWGCMRKVEKEREAANGGK